MAVRALRQALHLLVAVGLLADPCVRQPGPIGDGHTPTWRSGWHGPAAIGREARTEVLSAEPSDGAGARKTSSGGAPLGAAGPTRRRVVPARGEANWLPRGSHDERALLAQPHLRVNGSANAHGGRA